MNSEWLLLQLSDSAFPAGGFAHSNGLESAWQHGRVPDSPSLENWIRCQLHQSAHGAGPIAHAAHREPDRLDEWDAMADAMLNNHVANRASRAQGQAFLFATSRSFPGSRLLALAAQVRKARLPGHFAPIFGAVCQALELEAEAMIRLLLFLSLRSSTSAAVRLGLTGPMEAQCLQWRLSAYAESLVSITLKIPIDDAAQTAPMLELLQGTQDRLYSRLFQS